ncbi:MAG: choline monooxygenase, partial [Gammaproteobacteria bacterium RIFCSPHIGHO2_12_FULL_42_10]
METLHVDADITQASTLPASFYTSEDWFETAKEKIFAKTWQFCVSSETLQQPGQVVPFNILPGMLDEPILFTRDTAGQLHCLSNVCTHRANILLDKPCTVPHILCGYHGRRFNLGGEFLHMPEFAAAKNFPSASDHLPHVPFGQLGNFLFAAIQPVMTLDDALCEVKRRLFWLPFEKMHFDVSRSRDYMVNAHWSLYCENYLEALHIPFVHKGLRSVLDFGAYTTELYRYSSLQLALSGKGELSFDLPRESPDYGKEVAAYYYWIFPNTMLNFYPWGCSVNVVQPLAPGLTKVSFLSFVLDEDQLGKGAGGALDRVEMEDEGVVEAVQKGIRSRFYDKGRYSPSQET